MTLTGLIFVLAFATGCVLAFLRHPNFGFLTYVATLFLSPALRWWGQGPLESVRWSLISAGVTFLALLLGKKTQRPLLPFFSHRVVIVFLLFVVWLCFQSLSALAPAEHNEFLRYYINFAIALALMYRCIDSEENLRLFLWTYVGGCFYFGWIAYTTYTGGRFEGFGGAGISEANAGALTLVTGTLAASSLFLWGKIKEKAALTVMIAFILNGMVTTISRSGFLALAAGGIVFNFFTPKHFRSRVRALSVLALVLFGIVAGPAYWDRINSIKHAGEEVEEVEDDGGRLVIIQAQWKMFLKNPMGCGATCTTVLSPQYLDRRYLAFDGKNYVRASHNTTMTMLVEHGIPGIVFYLFVLLWVAKNLLQLGRTLRGDRSFLATFFPAMAAMFAALTVGDQFVTYAKFEIRIWFMGLLMVMLNLAAMKKKAQEAAAVAEKAAAPVAAGKVLLPARARSTPPRA